MMDLTPHMMTILVAVIAFAALGLAIAAYVRSDDVATNSVEAGDIQAGAVGNAALAANAVTTAKILDGAVTPAKLDGTSSTITLSDAASITLTETAHAGKILFVPDMTATSTIDIPAPSKAGVTYKFLYYGVDADAQNHVLDLAAGVFLRGGVTWVADPADTATANVVFGNGTSSNALTLVTPGAYEITLVAVSTTVFHLSGYIASQTIPTMA
jgi:hypothetical protein